MSLSEAEQTYVEVEKVLYIAKIQLKIFHGFIEKKIKIGGIYWFLETNTCLVNTLLQGGCFSTFIIFVNFFTHTLIAS